MGEFREHFKHLDHKIKQLFLGEDLYSLCIFEFLCAADSSSHADVSFSASLHLKLIGPSKVLFPPNSAGYFWPQFGTVNVSAFF